jgi:hypothetical protein
MDQVEMRTQFSPNLDLNNVRWGAVELIPGKCMAEFVNIGWTKMYYNIDVMC